MALEPGLRERQAGAFEGLTRAEILERFPGSLDHSPVDPPGGESIGELAARIHAALGRIAAAFDGGDVLAVSHGGVIRQVERECGIEPRPVPNLGGCWVEVRDGRLSLGERVLLLDDDDAAPITVPRGL